jgi:antitoxin component of RelBE/YafQ-DinJ toxin-antitoxin module
MPEQSVVRVDSKLLDEVQTYCRITGMSVSTVLNQMLAEFIERGDLHIRLESMLKKVQERVEKNGSKARLSMGEQELLARYLPQEELEPGEEPYSTIHLHNNEPVPVKWRNAFGREMTRVEAGEEKLRRQGESRVIKQVRAAQADDRQKERAREPGSFQTRVVK